jgi:hypothetical protein
MVLFSQVGKLVNDEVINNVWRSHNEPPVQTNPPVEQLPHRVR